MLPPVGGSVLIGEGETGALCPVLPATFLERCQAWCGQGGAVLREKTGEFRAVLSSCVSTWLAHQPWQPRGLSTGGS